MLKSNNSLEQLTARRTSTKDSSATVQMKPNEICCDRLEARLVSKFSTIVLGGTAASHTCSGVGGRCQFFYDPKN